MVPIYFLERVARHSETAQKLINELEDIEAPDPYDGQEVNNLLAQVADDQQNDITSIAFDAADLVWVFLALRGYDDVQETREVRNRVAQDIIQSLKGLKLTLKSGRD